MKPQAKGKKFKPLAVATFNTSSLKITFEKNFAAYKRDNPSISLSISRSTPPKSPSDRDLPDLKEIK
jgi:hypothetical protein